MKKTKCYSVRLKSLVSVSNRAYKAEDFAGNSAILPKSQVFGDDFEVQKSEAYWIAAWILEQKSLEYSRKKEAWFDADTGKMLPTYTVVKHTPEKVEPKDNNTIKRLKR